MADPAAEPTDEALAAACDDPAAFDRLARRYQVPLLRFLSRCVGRDAAEDVLQETFARLFVGRRAFNPRQAYRTWAFTIARRCAIDHARRRKGDPREATLRLSPDPADLAEAADESRSLWALAGRVCRANEMQAMWLYYGESMTSGEVARVLGVSGLGARMLLSRGRRRLRSAMEADRASGGLAAIGVRT